MEKSEIIVLIEALCERPLEDRQVDPPAELQAFCRDVAKALSQAASTRHGPDITTDVDRYTAALATLLSGSDAEEARRTFAEATLRSAAARLDAESALAFVDAIEQSPQTAPTHLVEEMLAADGAADAGSALPRYTGGLSSVWSAIVGDPWSARRWRMSAACAVLLVAGVASWSAYRLQTNPIARGSAVPTAKTASQQRSFADAPAPPRPAPATTQSCKLSAQASKTRNAERPPAEVPKAGSPAGLDCTPTPGHQFADRPAEENEAIAARQQAEAARQAASARAAADAASRVGAAHVTGEKSQADRSGSMFGTSDFHRPAAALPAPAAVPAMRPAAPGMR